MLMLGSEADAQLSRQDTLPDDVPAAGQTAPGAETSQGVEEEPRKPCMERAGLASTSPVLPNLTAHPC